METPGEEEPSSHDTIPHTVPHPPDGIASPTNSAEDFTQPPVDLSQASDHNTPRGTVQHHDYHHSTVPKQLAQPMDVEASFPQDMMEASVAGAVTPGYTFNSNQAPVQIHKQSKCQTNIAETINSSNTFKIDQVHNEVHNHNQVHNEKNVYQPRITYNISHTYITGDKEIPFQAVTGVTEHGALSSEDDEAVDNMVTTDSFRRALDILTTGERLLLLSAHPGLTRQSFLSALRRHYRKKGYTVYDLSCVSDWDKKGPVERGSLVIFDCAFGDVRLDREQYHRFYKHSLYYSNSLTTKLVFVVYPHILLEIERYDRASVRPLLNSMEVVELEQDHTLSVQPYADLFLRMLYDRKHGQMIGALLGLTMKSQGRFLANPTEVVYQLKCLGFPKFSATQLDEYCSLFKGSLLATCDSMFINRVLYDAAGLALGRSYLEKVLLQVCDVKFLVQHVRTQHTVTDPSVVLISQPDNGRLMIQRMVEELGRGKLPEMVQHPCLHSPEFLQELEAFCREDQLQLVLDTNDSEHSLSLLYWSVWGPSTHLTEWCLSKMVETGNDHAPQNMIRAAFLSALVNKVRTRVSGIMSHFRDCLTCILHLDYNEKLNLPLPPAQQRYLQELNAVCDNIIEKVKQLCFCYLDNTPMLIPIQLFTAEVIDETIYLSLPCRHAYLAFRLLTDQHVDGQDREGNTVLHLAVEAGLLEVIKLAVRSGASLTVKNKAGLIPPQLAERRLGQKEDVVDSSQRRDDLIFDSCKAGDNNSVKELLCYSATVDSKDKSGFTPLHVAAKYGQTDIAILLTDLNANLSATDMLGETPLHHACIRRCLEIVKLLVQHGSDVNAQDRYKMTPLHDACAQNDKDSAKVLLHRNADVNLRNSNGHTPLQLACLNSHWDTAEVLLQYFDDINGSLHEDDLFTLLHHAIDAEYTELAEFLLLHNALVDAKTSTGSTPLHLACQGKHTDIAQLLLKHGANVNMKTHRGVAPLHYACMAGCTDIVEMLVSNKASVDVKTRKMLTPLHYACIRGHTDIVGLLASNNANVNVKSRAGLTLLHYACKENKADIARVLVANRADVNVTNTDNDTPLHYACRGNNSDIVRLLLNHGADVNVQNTDGVTALHDACWCGYTDVVRLLLRCKDTVSLSDDEGKSPSTVLCEPPAKVNINMKDNSGWTALYRACACDHTETVQLLLQQDDIDVNVTADRLFSWVNINGITDIAKLLLLHNADVNVPDSRGRTPLHWVCMYGHLDVVPLLLQHGADVNISDGDGETLLLQACTHGHQDIVQYVLQHNADMNKESLVLCDALNTAQWNGHRGIVQLLQQNMSWMNANLCATDMLGKTPLHHACSRRCLETVTRLVLHGSDVNAQDRYKMTPLHEACAQNDKDSAKVLLHHNADVNLRNSNGHTPLQLACLNSHWDTAEVLLQYFADINGSLHEDDLFTLLHHAIDVGDIQLAEFLLLHNALIDANNSTGFSPLHLACQGKHTDIAQLLLKHGANVNMKTRRGVAPLHYACMAGCTDIVRMLVSNRASVNVKTRKMLTPLHYACIRGHTDIVSLLASNNADVNVKSRSGLAPLHYACIRGHPDIMGLLLSLNSNVNVKTGSGLTPLHYACKENKANIARLLVANRADVNFINTDNDTPLHYACFENDAEIVRLLLNHRADVNVQNTDGDTALHAACRGAETDVVRLLLGCKDTVSLSDDEGKSPSTVICVPLTKVNINMEDKEGRTALYRACEAGNIETVRLLLQQDDIDVNAAGDDCISPLQWVCIVGLTDIAQLLLLHNADVNMSDSGGKTPLHFACMWGHRDVVHLLLQHGADVNIPDSLGMTPLHFACMYGHRDVVHILLQHGADVNIPDSLGMTPLYCAFEDYHHKIVHLLLQHGANVNISDGDGETVLLQACTHGHHGIVQYVLQHNPDMNKERSVLYTALNAAQRKGHTKIVQLLQRYKSPSHPDSVPQQPSLQLSAQ